LQFVVALTLLAELCAQLLLALHLARVATLGAGGTVMTTSCWSATHAISMRLRWLRLQVLRHGRRCRSHRDGRSEI
jgi:hypothetical protein